MLRDIAVQRAYHKGKGRDDIAGQFYLPAVSAARRYDRAVGYFSSSIYLLAWPSLKRFVGNGGRMRLLCSPVLAAEDEIAMRQGYSEAADQALAETIKRQLASLLSSPSMVKPTTVLASLVANGVIECRIAWVTSGSSGRARRIFHDKVGIFEDSNGDRLVFKGSMNETWPALSLDGNIESIDVYASWRDQGELERVREEERYFDDVWNGKWPEVVVKPLPESARSEIISAADPSRWEGYIDDISAQLDAAARWSVDAGEQGGRLPRPHQIAALEAWVARGRRGIFEHATGSGKTFTALCAINAAFHLGEVALVLVPSDLLLTQWSDELRDSFGSSGFDLLVCGGGHMEWRTKGLLRNWTRPSSVGDRPRVVLATLQTASSPAFLALCSAGSHILMVADEVHRLGATEARSLLSLETGPRLGLSATPQRAGDPVGTQALMDYFGGVVPPPFTLQDAIAAEALTAYAYHPVAIAFEADEQQEWERLTSEIRRQHARGRREGVWEPAAEQRFKMLLIARARIAKKARRKVGACVDILSARYERGQRWIVYCDDQHQLGAAWQSLRAAGLDDVYEYHSAMRGDRAATLEVFERAGGILVSIRCLDEGVDIPSVTHALILASSRNPREFIQRRGRVLRRFPGKLLAHVHDVLVTPATSDGGDGDFDTMLRGEFARAIEFGRHAINPGGITELRLIADRMNIDWNTLAATGDETAGEDENRKDAENG